MLNKIIILFFVYYLSAANAQNGCSSYFKYTINGDLQQGLITLPVNSVPEHRIRIQLSVASQITSYVGEIELAKDRHNAVADIQQGLPLLYRIKFPIQNPVPKLTAIYYNDELICTGPKDVGQFVTTITLDHKLTTGLQEQNPGRRTTPPTFVDTNWQRPQLQTTTWVPPIQRPSPPRPVQTPPPSTFELDDCGIPDNRLPLTTGLIVRGNDVRRGQFPWLAAYYHSGQGDSGFICGGSLISQKLIVTAAHCIQGKTEVTKRKAEEAQFYLGKNNLNTLNGEIGHIVSGVSQFIVHTAWNYNSQSYDADIALAVLSRTIIFNKFIKPICLWTSTNDYNDLIGKEGYVAGWGKTEKNAVSTPQPKWTKIPVVAESTCLRSDNSFATLTSDRTFCAGDRTGMTGPCNGDSGGGFVVQSGNRWYLRGIISASLLDQIQNTCDTKNYAVFTDLTKFSDWVQRLVQQYG